MRGIQSLGKTQFLVKIDENTKKAIMNFCHHQSVLQSVDVGGVVKKLLGNKKSNYVKQESACKNQNYEAEKEKI